MDNKVIIGIIIVAVVLLGGWFFITAMNEEPSNQQTNTNEQVNNKEEEPVIDVEVSLPGGKTHEVSYTNAGYSPAEVKIKSGDKVKFINNSTRNTWPASAMHPTHAVYSGTNLQAHCPDNENDDFDACKDLKPGESWDFTFNKKGTWAYHDHSNPTYFGKVVVE